MAFKLPTIAEIINKMTDEERTFLTNVLDTTQVTEWQVIQTLPETKEICMAVMQIPNQRSCIGILWNNSKNDYYLIDIFSGYQTPIYHIVDEVITPVAEYCTTLEVRYWLTNGGGGGDNDYINSLKEVLAVNGLDVEFGRNVEIDGNAQINGNLNVGGETSLNNTNIATGKKLVLRNSDIGFEMSSSLYAWNLVRNDTSGASPDIRTVLLSFSPLKKKHN